MALLPSLLRQLENPKLSRDQRAKRRCQFARQLEDRGEYEDARQAMGELWQRIDEYPNITGLDQSTAAEVLLRAGVLAGIIGSRNQITGAQETAKNLITQSLTIFHSLHYAEKIAEAKTELALCYWRTGEYNEARDVLKDALARLTISDELKARALLRWAIVELEATCYKDSHHILIDNAPFFEKVNNHTIKGSYHITLANVLENLWESEKQGEYISRAFVEYTAAGYHFEQAGHKCYRAHVENNLGFLHFKARRYREAHEHLDRSRRLFISLRDSGAVAQVDETRAKVFLAEGRYAEAEKTARTSVMILEQGGEQAVLTEALITHGTALARLGYYSQAYATLQHAIEAGQSSGSFNRAGEAALVLIEELGEHLTPRAVKMPSYAGVFRDVKRYEHELIKQALIDAKGSITHAALLLGISRQHLTYLLEHRHKELMVLRKPIVRRPKQEK